VFDLDFHSVEKTRNRFLYILSLIVLLGLVMVYSSSYIYAKESFGSSTHFFIRQLFFVILGASSAYIISKTKINFWIKYAPFLSAFGLLVLLLTLIPDFSNEIKGANRWVRIAGVKFQPAEFIKFSTLLQAIYIFFDLKNIEIKKQLKHYLLLFTPLLLLLKQPDFGSFTICLLVIIFVVFLSDFSRKYFYSFVSVGLVSSILILIAEPYRIKRVLAFLDPWKNPKTSGFQIIQSYLAFANGSFFGQGLGNSNEKLFYLPEAHNDFIMSVIGEELGFFGVSGVVVLFALFLYFGFRLATYMDHSKLIAVMSAIIFTFGIQSSINMAVVLGLLPTKGLNLPFVSYGGSSILANFIGVGLILSAVRASVYSSKSHSLENDGDFQSQQRIQSVDSHRFGKPNLP
jgi:cell division protein FtsW